MDKIEQAIDRLVEASMLRPGGWSAHPQWAPAGDEKPFAHTPPETHPGMVPCDVEEHHSAWLVTFEDGSDLLLQTDYDQAAFAVNSGELQAPRDWDGTPSTLPGWNDFDPSAIWECPDEYLVQAEMSRQNESTLRGGTLTEGMIGRKYTLLKKIIRKRDQREFPEGSQVTLKLFRPEYPYAVLFEDAEGEGIALSAAYAYRYLQGFPKPPTDNTMMKWSFDGVAKAVDGSRIEPDGKTAEGVPSWLLVMGLI